jgi:hypothetical protein
MKLEINGKKIETQEYVDKWVNFALEETTTTDEQVTKNVQWLYKQAGFKKPKVVVFRDYQKFIDFNWSSVESSVWSSVGSSVWSSVESSVGSSVESSVWSSVGSSVESSVRSSVWSSVGSSVGSSVWSSVRSSVGSSVESSVWSSVGSSVESSVRSSVGLWYWAEYMAYADVFADCNILDTKKKKELKKYLEVLSTQRMAVFTEDICYVLVAPKIIRNDEGQLHNEKGLAVDWSGTGMYFLKGIEFTKEWHTKIVNDQLTPEEILAIDNTEHRRVAWEFMDKKKLEGLDGFEVLDKVKNDGKGYPMRIIQFNHPDAGIIRYYNCFCPTTGREYYLGTEETTCEKAKAKSFGLEEVEFINEW